LVWLKVNKEIFPFFNLGLHTIKDVRKIHHQKGRHQPDTFYQSLYTKSHYSYEENLLILTVNWAAILEAETSNVLNIYQVRIIYTCYITSI
jgi:hypothetical protein